MASEGRPLETSLRRPLKLKEGLSQRPLKEATSRAVLRPLYEA
jgi:hypothetical protein